MTLVLRSKLRKGVTAPEGTHCPSISAEAATYLDGFDTGQHLTALNHLIIIADPNVSQDRKSVV